MFDTVCIVGVGLIGGSFGMALRQKKLARRVVGVVRRQATTNEATALGAIDEGTPDLVSAARRADLIFLAPPVGQMIPLCRQIADAVPEGALVTDAGSTKAAFADECEAIFEGRAHFIGGHPMAGSEQTGVAAARADLFEGATWVLTPTPKTPPDALEKLSALVESLGARPLVMDARAHDCALATTSHLPHITASALVNEFTRVLQSEPLAEQLVAGGWRDSTRVAAGSGEMWRDICLANAEAIDASLASLVADLEDVRRWVREGDGDKLRAWFEDAAAVRRKHGAPPKK